MNKVVTFWEASDVANALGVVPGTVRNYVLSGALRVAATTPRGVRLFRPEDVLVFYESLRRRRAHAVPMKMGDLVERIQSARRLSEPRRVFARKR
jgi:hypothetical protein